MCYLSVQLRSRFEIIIALPEVHSCRYIVRRNYDVHCPQGVEEGGGRKDEEEEKEEGQKVIND